jgi:hypothetical protein
LLPKHSRTLFARVALLVDAGRRLGATDDRFRPPKEAPVDLLWVLLIVVIVLLLVGVLR